MGRRSVHSPEELRQLILDASQTIVERNGITGLSAREIARMIGYSPGTLYNIFENLDDVLLTLQVQLLGRIVDHLKRVPLGPDGEKNIDALTHAYVDFALVNRRMWNLLFAHSVPPRARCPRRSTTTSTTSPTSCARHWRRLRRTASHEELDAPAARCSPACTAFPQSRQAKKAPS